jgi:hypothetical protein
MPWMLKALAAFDFASLQNKGCVYRELAVPRRLKIIVLFYLPNANRREVQRELRATSWLTG